MAPQLAWIGLGNMGRVNSAPPPDPSTFTDHDLGHVQEPSRERAAFLPAYNIQPYREARKGPLFQAPLRQIHTSLKHRGGRLEIRHHLHLRGR